MARLTAAASSVRPKLYSSMRRDRADGAEWIGFVLSRDIGRGAVHRFVKAGPCAVGLLRADRGRGQHADGAGQHRAFIAQDVAEHVLGHAARRSASD